MAPKPASLALIDHIEQELAGLETRATELRHALKVVREFTAEPSDSPPNVGEVGKPTFQIAGPGRSRLAAIKGKEIDETNGAELHRD